MRLRLSHSFAFIGAVAGIVFSAAASAELVTAGSYSSVFFRDCAHTSCDGFTRRATAAFQDSSASSTSHVVAAYPALAASGSAASLLPGSLLAPELKAGMQIGPGGWMSSQTAVVQRYVNTGVDPIKVALGASLDWTVLDGVTPPGQLPNGLLYQLTVFENNSGLINVDFSSITLGGSDLLTLIIDPTAVDHLLYSSTDLFGQTGSTNVSSPLLTLDPGKGFFLGARMVALGGFGAAVDATHTFRTFFTDENGVVLDGTGPLQLAHVPEPGAFSLLAASLLGLAAMRRQRGPKRGWSRIRPSMARVPRCPRRRC